MVANEKEGESGLAEEIVLKKGRTEVKVLAQGAMITSFKVGGQDILLPDQYFVTEKGTKRRGGIPLLFPQAGPLTEEKGRFNLPQHGFVRDAKWSFVEVDQVAESVVLETQSSDETKRMYPYDFKAKYKIRLSDGVLRADLRIDNMSGETLPIAPGFHPYFQVNVQDKPAITTSIKGFNPDEYGWDTSQFYDAEYPTVLNLPNGRVTINASPEFRKLVVWSEPDRPHVCVEPWTGNVNAILKKEERINIGPGETSTLWMEIKFELKEA